MGKKMEIMGNDGIGMGNTQKLRSPVWVCSFHEVELSRENWIVQGQRKSVEKKTSCSTDFVCYTRSYFLLLSVCQRMRPCAPERMRAFLNDI